MTPDSTEESRFYELEKPEFHSRIPDSLVDDLNPTDRHVISSLSILEQQNEWLVNSVLRGNQQSRQLDIRLAKVESWKGMLTSKWSVVLWFVGVIVWLSPIAQAIYEIVVKVKKL
jgi:hypothetical protein